MPRIERNGTLECALCFIELPCQLQRVASGDMRIRKIGRQVDGSQTRRDHIGRRDAGDIAFPPQQLREYVRESCVRIGKLRVESYCFTEHLDRCTLLGLLLLVEQLTSSQIDLVCSVFFVPRRFRREASASSKFTLNAETI